MSKTPLYKMLQDVPSSGGWTLATLLDGSVSGSQLLLQAGKPVWQAGPADFMRRDLSGLQSCTATGVQLIEGQHVFVERFGAVPQLVVCGGGHVAAATVRLARLLGLPDLAIDDREEYAQQLRDAGADNVLCLPFEQALKQVPGSAETYFIVVTRAHAFDVICLEQILRKPAAYVGMMGSRGRSALVRRQLLDKGLEEKRVEALYAPIGLAIGSQTAEEIALSILAQVVSIKNACSQTEGFSSAIRCNGSGRPHGAACCAGCDHGTAWFHSQRSGGKNAGPCGRHGRWQRGRRYYRAPPDSGCAGNAGGKYSGTAADAFFGRWKRRRRCSRCLRRFDGNMVGHSAGRRGA